MEAAWVLMQFKQRLGVMPSVSHTRWEGKAIKGGEQGTTTVEKVGATAPAKGTMGQAGTTTGSVCGVHPMTKVPGISTS